MVTIAPERLSWLSHQNLQDQAAEAHLWFEKWVQIDYGNWEQKKIAQSPIFIWFYYIMRPHDS